MVYQWIRPVLLLLMMMAVNVSGCGRKGMSKADREHAIQESLDEIETIKNDPTMSPQKKQDLIERSQLQLDELRGGKSENK